jgi:hypothetical protein
MKCEAQFAAAGAGKWVSEEIRDLPPILAVDTGGPGFHLIELLPRQCLIRHTGRVQIVVAVGFE